jgi:predicted nucleic acid-binding protein
MGTLGVLIKAKDKRIITSLREEIKNLQDVGFRMSDDLIFNILNKHE